MKPALTLKSTQAPKRPNLFLALPTYCGIRYNTMAIVGALSAQQSFGRVSSVEIDGSLLASTFNNFLIRALDLRDEGKADYMLLLHSDIMPMDTQGWLDVLWQERCKVDADAISAVVPIKDARGVTSTALETPDNIYAPRRLTMREIEQQDVTFTDDNLLINTGMLLINLRAPWVDNFCFTIGDALLRLPSGKRAVGVTPEDWNFSRRVRELGGRVWATRAVQLTHIGRFAYPNFGGWGIHDEDPGDAKETTEKK